MRKEIKAVNSLLLRKVPKVYLKYKCHVMQLREKLYPEYITSLGNKTNCKAANNIEFI